MKFYTLWIAILLNIGASFLMANERHAQVPFHPFRSGLADLSIFSSAEERPPLAKEKSSPFQEGDLQSQLALYAHHNGTKRIQNLVIFGERHSGTTYLKELILTNFPYLTGDQKFFGWKHGPAWLEAPPDAFPGDPKGYLFEPNDSNLFVVIFRDPYDWIISMWHFPYHASQKFFEIPLMSFLTMPWEIEINDMSFSWRDYITAIERNPIDGSLFPNIMKLRTAKIKNMLLIKNKVKNIYYVNYETIRDRPEEVVQELANFFDLPKVTPFTAVTQYCSQGKVFNKDFTPKSPIIISDDILRFVNSQLDEEIENSIGYQIK